MLKLAEITGAEFDKFAQEHKMGSIFQDSRWAQVKADNWQAKFVALKSANEIAVASLILIRTLPLGFRMWYLPRGPLFDVENPDNLKNFSDQLKLIAKRERCILVKIDPNLIISSSSFSDARAGVDNKRDQTLIKVFQSAGWRHFGFNKAMADTIQPRFSAVRYFDKKTDLVQEIAKKHRQQIRKWQNLGVTTREVGLDEIDDLMTVMNYTAQAKNISLRDKQYFTRLKESFGDDCLLTITSISPKTYLQLAKNQQADLLAKHPAPSKNQSQQITAAQKILDDAEELANKHQQPINLSASVSLLVNRELNMLYASMNREFRQFYATHIANVWRIEWAQRRGASQANLGGIDGNLSDTLSEFKSALGANVNEYVGEFNLYTYPILSWTFDKLLPTVKRALLKFKRR